MVDSVGHPIAGVVVTPDGLRPKSDSSSRGGHFGWTEKSHDVKPTPLISDANGRIRLRFPRYVHDRVETGEVSFEVDHPDYCFDRPFRAVSAAPSRSGGLKARLKFGLFQLLPRGRFTPEPVVLQSGAVVRVSAKNAGGEPLTHFDVQLPGLSWLNSSNDWRTVAPGVKESRRVPAGPRTLRVVQPGGTRPVGFAEPVRFAVTTVGTNSFTCSVLPGLRVTGRLDSAVPRPVANGRIVVEVISGGASRPEDRIVWHTWTKVSAGGEFTFESLPAGEAEFVGICDGWVSVNGTHVSRPGGSVVPQLITLPLATGHLVLPMEPAGGAGSAGARQPWPAAGPGGSPHLAECCLGWRWAPDSRSRLVCHQRLPRRQRCGSPCLLVAEQPRLSAAHRCNGDRHAAQHPGWSPVLFRETRAV